ncbi:iron complex outermembrane receptor protein [Chitinophaga niastensis]|uniref:Iron complex outermembrane receptor protein n=1 Tax=Chitinophaga niastensis TaxID=536980 RepID=A0A2P8HUV2_CHINA|nr:TonB-dependent receptor [Chitinophaga niastensis]PSL50009.1 iron complex outermembrane receptor protein [Chitinophaga niastensis]
MNLKLSLLACLSWLLLNHLPARANDIDNNSLSGNIIDANSHQPLIGATIYIPDLHAGAASDAKGHFRLNNLPSGKYLLEVKFMGYKNISQTIVIKGDVKQDFILYTSAVEQNEIVVTGQSKATEIRRSPVPLVAVNTKYLKENFSTNIIDAIAKVPGVSGVTTGPNVSKPFIRGLGYNRVLTLFNGMRQEGQQWGDEHGIEVDQYGIDRVEIVKGPASLTYGSDAMAGVVNLIPTAPAPEGKIIGNVMAEYQTNNGLAGGSAMMSGNNKGFTWLARLSRKEAKNYQNKIDGRVYGTNFKETDASASLGINRGWGFSHLDLSMYDDLQAIPDGSRDSASRKFTKRITEDDTERPIVSDKELNSYGLPVLHQHVQHYRAFSSNSFNLGESSLSVGLGFEKSVRREFSHPEQGDVPGLYLKLNTLTYDIKYYFPEWGGWDLTAGVNGMYQSNNVTSGTEFVIPSYHQFDAGPFVMAKKSFGKLDISGGARYDIRSFNNDALLVRTNPKTGFDMPVTDTAGASQPFNKYSHTFSGFTGSLGLTYNFSEHFSVKANIARGFRSPNIAEISANGVHPGTNIYQLGNSNFKPEFSLQEDIGADFISDHISASLSLFNNDIQHYIFNQKVLNGAGQDSVIVPGNQTFQYQAAHARLYGGEFSLDIHPHPLDWLHFENSVSVVYAENKGQSGKAVNDSAKYLPFIPPVHGVSELRAEFKKPATHIRNMFVKVQMAWYAKQDRAYLAYNTETATPGYTLFNAGIGTDITDHAGKTLFTVSVFGNNLFDIGYQDHLSRLKYFEQYPNDPRGRSGIYNMGRNVGVRISVPFNLR